MFAGWRVHVAKGKRHQMQKSPTKCPWKGKERKTNFFFFLKKKKPSVGCWCGQPFVLSLLCLRVRCSYAYFHVVQKTFSLPCRWRFLFVSCTAFYSLEAHGLQRAKVPFYFLPFPYFEKRERVALESGQSKRACKYVVALYFSVLFFEETLLFFYQRLTVYVHCSFPSSSSTYTAAYSMTEFHFVTVEPLLFILFF